MDTDRASALPAIAIRDAHLSDCLSDCVLTCVSIREANPKSTCKEQAECGSSLQMKPQNITGDALTISDKTRTATKADGTVLRIVDALFDMPVQPTLEELKNGVPGSKTHCAYCLACARMFGSGFVWIARRVAYVELNTGTDEEPELVRFIISKPGRANARDFDLRALNHLQKVSKRTVLFLAPKPYQRLDAEWRKRGNAKLAAKRAAKEAQRKAQRKLPAVQRQAIQAAERKALQHHKAQKPHTSPKPIKTDPGPDWWRRSGTGESPAHVQLSQT
jgi:hypothetical protein